MLVEQGLGKYCDPDFVRYTSREMQEALDMTSEEMDMAAHQLLQQERGGNGAGPVVLRSLSPPQQHGPNTTTAPYNTMHPKL